MLIFYALHPAQLLIYSEWLTLPSLEMSRNRSPYTTPKQCHYSPVSAQLLVEVKERGREVIYLLTGGNVWISRQRALISLYPERPFFLLLPHVVFIFLVYR